MMQLPAGEMIQDKPAVSIQRHDGAQVTHRIGQPLVTIMLTPPGVCIMLQDGSPGPICPGEAGEHFHLILAVDSYRVMDCCVSQPISPTVLAAIEVGPRVTGDVYPVPPQIDVELIGMGGAGMEVCAAQDGFAVGAMKEVHAAIREGGWGGFRYPRPDFGFTSAPIHAGNCLIPIQPK